MGVAERRQREKEAVRSQILAAATELFATQGVSAVSIRKIAERIEYAPSTIYLYFKDKEELCSAIIIEAFAELTEILRHIHEENLPPLEALEKGLRAYIRFGMEHPYHYSLTFGQNWIMNFPNHLSAADRAGADCFEQLRRALKRCMDEDSIRPANLDLLSQTVWMFIHGTTDILNTSQRATCQGDEFPWAPVNPAVDLSIDLIMRAIQK